MYLLNLPIRRSQLLLQASSQDAAIDLNSRKGTSLYPKCSQQWKQEGYAGGRSRLSRVTLLNSAQLAQRQPQQHSPTHRSPQEMALHTPHFEISYLHSARCLLSSFEPDEPRDRTQSVCKRVKELLQQGTKM